MSTCKMHQESPENIIGENPMTASQHIQAAINLLAGEQNSRNIALECLQEAQQWITMKSRHEVTHQSGN